MSSVVVHIYDISKGLAKALSPSLLGKQLDGIWHSGVVAYGEEFYFGGAGIATCYPGGTILGNPDVQFDAGTTEIPKEVFESYLFELAQDKFRPERYHLFDHNCNTFSNEVTQFLTSKNIPSYVTDLPKEVENTPIGAMVRNMHDAMAPREPHNTFAGAQTTTVPTTSHEQKQISSREALQNFIKEQKPLTFAETLTQADVAAFKSSAKVSAPKLLLLNDLIEFSSAVKPCSTMTQAHCSLLEELLTSPTALTSPSAVKALLNLVSLCVLKAQFSSLLPQPLNQWLTNFLQENFSTLDADCQRASLRLLCNITSTEIAQQWLLQSLPKAGTASSSEQTASKNDSAVVTVTVCQCILNGQNLDAASTVLHNLALLQMSSDDCLALGSAVINVLLQEQSTRNEETSFCLLLGLASCALQNNEVLDLYRVMGVDLNCPAQPSVRCAQLCQLFKGFDKESRV